jgi:hypothetical protein
VTQKTFFGTIFVVLFVCAGLFVICLFSVPTFTPWGMGGVFVQGKYMTYVDPDLEYIFNQENFIIESSKADVFIRVRKVGQMDQGYVQVFEDANGVSFNSVKRTQVDFMETLDNRGVPYVKIRVREPKGMMMRKARVYINLKAESILSRPTDFAGYNFVFNTGASPVNIDFDDAVTDELKINRLDVYGTGRIVFNQPEKSTIEYLNIASSNANFNCRSEVKITTTVTGGSSNISLGKIQTLDINGGHKVNCTSASNVQFVGNGHLGITERAGKVVMRTDNMSFSCPEVASFDLRNFDGTGIVGGANISIGKVLGSNTIPTAQIGGAATTVNLTELSVISRVQNGSVNIGNIYGNVGVEQRYGSLNLTFANDIAANGSKVTLRVHDVGVNVHGIRAYCDILATSLGNSNISASFMPVAFTGIPPSNGSKIYIEGSREPNTNGGQIAVKLLNGASATIKTLGSSRYTANGAGGELENGVTYIVNGTSEPIIDEPVEGEPFYSPWLTLKTAASVAINAGTY